MSSDVQPDPPAEEKIDLFGLVPSDIAMMGDDRFRTLASQLLEVQQRDRKESALTYYKPVTDIARQVHTATSRTIGVGGGNGSSKTETCLVELMVCATGVVPDSLKPRQGEEFDPKRHFDTSKVRPGNYRVVVESLTTTLTPIILPKLKWFSWTGIDAPGGRRGHWGWIPRTSLKSGSWEKSWSEKLRTLKVVCRDPKDPGRILGESQIQFMSHDQNPEDFASGDFYAVLHDEPPSRAIWTENEARTMRVSGRMLLAMTWPDDPSIPVDWLFDEVYEPGEDPKREDVVWINLFTTDNPHLDQHAVSAQAKTWSKDVRDVRVFGKPIRFRNRIHPEFTDATKWWCFGCNESAHVENGACMTCGQGRVVQYNHCLDFDANPNWPTCFILDPHPRKDHMYMWVQVDPNDDLWQVAEGACPGGPQEVADDVFATEKMMGLHVYKRLIDPNMGLSPASSQRGITWQKEFDSVKLNCDLADDSDVGRSRFNDFLKPDPDTLGARAHVHPSCIKTIFQIKRYIWDDFKRSVDKDQKQLAKQKNDDYPTMWKYLMNSDPSFRVLQSMAQYIQRRSSGRPRKSNDDREWRRRAR